MYKKRQVVDVATMYGAFLNQAGNPNPTMVTDVFVRNMVRGYERFGCEFLYKRRAVNQSTLNGLVQAGTNPSWQQKLMAKIAFIDSLILKYRCKPVVGDNRLDCERFKPHCRKIDSLRNAGQFTQLNNYINGLAQMFGVSVNDIKMAYERCCRLTGGETPIDPVPISCERVSREMCEKYLYYVGIGDINALSQIYAATASQLGITRQQAADLLKRCCRPTTDPGTGISCERVPRDLCIKYEQAIMSGSQQAVNGVGQTLASMLNISITQALSLLKECCRFHSDPVDPTDPTDPTTTYDDCRIDCYKCNNGYPVMNKFDAVVSMKADGSGYIYDCPKGWTTDRTPCKENVSPTNTNTNTYAEPIRDVTGFVDDIDYVSSNETTPIRDVTTFTDSFGNAVSPVKSGPNVSVNTSNPGFTMGPGKTGGVLPPVADNTGVVPLTTGTSGKTGGPFSGVQPVSSSNYLTPLRFSGGGDMWMSDNY